VLDGRHGELDRLGIVVADGDDLGAAAGSDLAITLPGTNTVQLAVLGVPMLVVLPLDRPGRIRTEGLSEWLARIPGLGAAIKGVMVWQFLRRPHALAWPNRQAGRMVVPEMVGRLEPAEVARRALAMLDDRPGLEAAARELRELYRTPAGVAERILEAMAGPLETLQAGIASPA
jgi:lipid-A-disaccharide synthase